MLHIKLFDCIEYFAQFSNECAKTSYNAFLVFIMYSNERLPKSLERGSSRNRTTDTSVFTAMSNRIHQALTGIGDQIETISLSHLVTVCSTGTPPESRNADLATQQHHLPRKDEIARLEAV